MPNDPAQTAQSLLNGIDYSALIGGPLSAAVQAQAMAAKSTLDFIMTVGFNDQKETNNVTFTFIQEGVVQRLIVPVLVIVPIPCIEITDVSIAFKANINASSSSSSESASSQDASGSLGVAASGDIMGFKVSANINASYSSKMDSKATQDSRYSVEYTQDVAVKAAQAGVPAGLATILNILSNSSSTSNPQEDFSVSPVQGSLDASQVSTNTQGQDKFLIEAHGLPGSVSAGGCPKQQITLQRSGSIVRGVKGNASNKPLSTQQFLLTLRDPTSLKSLAGSVSVSFSPDLSTDLYVSASPGDFSGQTATCLQTTGNGPLSFSVSLLSTAKLTDLQDNPSIQMTLTPCLPAGQTPAFGPISVPITFTNVPATMSSDPSSLSASDSATSVKLTGVNTNWTSATTFSVTGGSGASIAAPPYTDVTAATATIQLTPGTAAGTLTITDSTDGAQAQVTVTSS